MSAESDNLCESIAKRNIVNTVCILIVVSLVRSSELWYYGCVRTSERLEGQQSVHLEKRKLLFEVGEPSLQFGMACLLLFC